MNETTARRSPARDEFTPFYVGVPAEYHVVGPFSRYVWHGYLVAPPNIYQRDRCIGRCEHPYERYRQAPDGTIWDGAGGSPVGIG